MLSGLAGREIEFRVAASTGHLGIVARLVCPVFGAALLGYRLDLNQAWWQPTVSGAMPLSLPGSAITPVDGRRGLAVSQIFGLVDRTAALAVSPKVLWGNVASAVNGAATTVATAREDLADSAIELAASLVESLSLGDTFVGAVGSSFRRRSCCLIYRIAPPGAARQSYCGDCVLARPESGISSKPAAP